MSIARLLTAWSDKKVEYNLGIDKSHRLPTDGVYLTGPQADFIKSFMSAAARQLQDERKYLKSLAQECYEHAEEGTPNGEAYFHLLNEYRDGIRKTRATEKKINSVIRSLKNR